MLLSYLFMFEEDKRLLGRYRVLWPVYKIQLICCHGACSKCKSYCIVTTVNRCYISTIFGRNRINRATEINGYQSLGAVKVVK